LGRDGKFFQREDSSAHGQDRQETTSVGVIEALEAYSAEHPEEIEDLILWPYKRFEAFYEAHLKRKAVDKLDAAKNALVSGLWSNPNLDDGKNTRQNILRQIEESFKDAIDSVYNKKEEPDIDFKKDPFFAAMKLPDLDPSSEEGESVTSPRPHDEDVQKLVSELDQS
jgi:hypothetical protein